MFIFSDPFARLYFDGEGGGGGGQGAGAGGQGSGGGQGGGGQGAGAGGQGSGGGQGGGGQGGSGGGQGSGGSGSGSGGHEETVPYDRFREANEQRQAAERERDQLRQQITERERQGLPELDRARAEAQDAAARAEAAERERDQLRAAGERRTREDLVRAAARDFQVERDGRTDRVAFHDPEDAVARINVDEIRSDGGALREVQALAQRAGHLVRPYETQQQGSGGGSGADLLQRVLEGGQRVDGQGQGNGQGQQKEVIPADQLNGMTADQLVALQESDPDLYARSLRAATTAAR
jgi:hypothetical protein